MMGNWEYYLEPGKPDLRACEIARYGWSRMCNAELAGPEYERLLGIFPDLLMADGTGPYGLCQTFYKPERRVRFIQENSGYIANAEKHIRRWREGLRQIWGEDTELPFMEKVE